MADESTSDEISATPSLTIPDITYSSPIAEAKRI